MFKIKELRKKKNESQSELAEAIGVSLRTIQNYEAGNVTIPTDKVQLIAQHYKVSIAYLLDISTEVIERSVLNIDEAWNELMKDERYYLKFQAEAFKLAIQEIEVKIEGKIEGKILELFGSDMLKIKLDMQSLKKQVNANNEKQGNG